MSIQYLNKDFNQLMTEGLGFDGQNLQRLNASNLLIQY